MTRTHLVYAQVRMTALYQWAAERNLGSRRGLDTGNALHILLAGMFGKGMIQPFRLLIAGRNPLSTLYGYSSLPAAALREQSEEAAAPDALRVLNAERLLTKVMPENWAEGKRVGYDTRVRPIRRWRAAVEGDAARPRALEIDAYEGTGSRRPHHARTNGSNEHEGRNGHNGRNGLTPEEAYRTWLEERFHGSAVLESCRMARYLEERGQRGRQEVSRGPTAVLQGTLVVKDSAEFGRRILKGVGRHKAYGYGMLLVRPPG